MAAQLISPMIYIDYGAERHRGGFQRGLWESDNMKAANCVTCHLFWMTNVLLDPLASRYNHIQENEYDCRFRSQA